MLRDVAIFALLPGIFSTAARAETLTGVVTNKTTDKPAGGDDVVLLKLAQGMQELVRTKTDARGHFKLTVPDGGPGELHMIRVTHDKANYFRPVQPGAQSVEVEVYAAAPEVEGVTLAEDVLQVQTEPGGTSLKVVEHYLLKNDSSPKKTLFGEHPFELNLPPDATVEGGAAKGPGGMAVQQGLVPTGEPGKYTILFAIRPGETEFHVWYHVPYKGSFTFHPKPTMATANLAVMLPKAMTFKTPAGSPFATVTEDVGGQAQAYVARDAMPSQPLEFTVSGTGALPRDQGAAGQGGGATAAAATGDASTDTRPGGGLGTPVDKDAERDPWTKYRWWIISGLGLAFATAAGFMMKAPAGGARASGSGPVPGPTGGGGTMQALRDELFSLETDRLAGRVNDQEYAELKGAYDTVLRRALERSNAETVRVVPE